MSIVKLVWVKFFVENLTLEYLQFFVPLSLSSMFNPVSLSKWLIYPLQTLNLFEIAYIFILFSLKKYIFICIIKKLY